MKEFLQKSFPFNEFKTGIYDDCHTIDIIGVIQNLLYYLYRPLYHIADRIYIKILDLKKNL